MKPALIAQHLGKDYRVDGLRYRTLRDGLSLALERLQRPLSGPQAPPAHAFTALNDVNFEIQQGETVGVIGRNGSGKSTLLKLLSRITPPTRGRAGVFGRCGSLLEVGTGFHPELTGRENIYFNGAILGMKRHEIQRVFDAVVDFAEVADHLDKPVKRYSSGMFMRLAFAVAAHLETEILLLDEVLAVGDVAFQQRCFQKIGELTQGGRTVLLVSHNMHAVRSVCSRSLLLERGRLIEDGATTAVSQRYEQAARASSSQPGVLYENPAPASGITIRKVELLGRDGRQLPFVSSWDYVRICFYVESTRDVEHAAVELHLSTDTGAPVLRLSSMPDANVPVRLTRGINRIDCEIPHLYLAAGEFILQAGITVPQHEWLVPMHELARLTVEPANVFQSAFQSPSLPENVIAIPHTWSVFKQ